MATKSPSVKLMKTPTPTSTPTSPVAEPKTLTKTLAAKPSPKKPEPVAEVEVEEAAEATEAIHEDLIVKTAFEVENMKADKAFKFIPVLLDNIDHDYFRLGGILSKVQSEGWFMEKGYETFRSFVEAECGIQYRKSMYLIQIYNGLVESGVEWNQVKHLGWSKLKELANILDSANVADWVAIAEGLTVLQLQDHIRESTKGENASNSPEVEGDVSKTTTMTFKLHQDQKATIREALDKAKHETGTEVDSVALEAMALDFLGGENKLKTMPSLVELMTGKSAEEVLEAFGVVFPEVSLEATLPDEA